MKHYICMSLFVIVMLIPICGCGNKKEKYPREQVVLAGLRRNLSVDVCLQSSDPVSGG